MTAREKLLEWRAKRSRSVPLREEYCKYKRSLVCVAKTTRGNERTVFGNYHGRLRCSLGSSSGMLKTAA